MLRERRNGARMASGMNDGTTSVNAEPEGLARRRARTGLLLPLSLLIACAAPVPASEPPALLSPAPPPGPDSGAAAEDACAADLSGLWRHAVDDGFRYRARDDGGTLVVAILRTDAGAAPSASLVLQRSPGGFVGAVALARPGVDGGCVALFPAEVVSCADAGLEVATVPRLRVDGACRPLDEMQARVRHRLVRVAPDAGP